MNGLRIAGLLLGVGLIAVPMMGASETAQSAGSNAMGGLKTNVQQLMGADAAVSVQTASATTATTETAKTESLTVANKEYDAAKELPRMAKRYSLTAEQKAKIGSLLLEQQRQVHALGEDESLTDAEWAEAVRKVHQETVLKVRKLLTDAQLSKYSKDELKRAKQPGDNASANDDGPPDGPPPDGGPPGGGGPGGGGPPD